MIINREDRDWGEGKREVDAEWDEERCVFVCLCVCLKANDIEYLLKMKKKTLCEGGYNL